MLYYKENNLLINHNKIRNKFILFCNNYEHINYEHINYEQIIFL